MKRVLLVCVILVGAFALRVNALGDQSLWYDEAVTARVAGQGLRELTRWTADDIQPPLYYYLVAGWIRVAGEGEWALRFPSAFFSTLTVALIASMGRRLLGGPMLGGPSMGGHRGLVAAILAAASALYVYHAQEARMYALLTFLGLLAGYALLRGWQAPAAGGRRWWATFAVSAAAALYTHYFAAFLLASYALVLMAAGLARQRGADAAARGSLRSKVRAAAAAFLAAGLLYAPWLPSMLNRYRVDASYWQGALKLGEALRHVAVNFVAGAPETMLEPDAVRWSVAVAIALALAALALVATALVATKPVVTTRRPRAPFSGVPGAVLALLVVLLTTVTAVLVLASRTPKFNPRYLMLASPAYLLLVSAAACALWQRRGGRVVAVALLAVVLAPGLLGIANWFGDPQFTKAQWREAAAFVQASARPDEAVVLVSGHAEPAWTYYAPQLEAVRLPATEILDVNAVLGFDAGTDLARALEGKSGVWLVLWQHEVADPMGVVPFLLDQAGDAQPVEQQFWHVGVRHWRLPASAHIATEPQPEHVLEVNFDHKLALLGWDDPENGELVVYWRTLNTLVDDYQVSLILEDAGGSEAGRWDGRPAAYGYPTVRWQVGKAVFGRYPLPAAPAEANGPFSVSLSVYSAAVPEGLDVRDVADNPAGKRVRLGPFGPEPGAAK